MRASRPRRPRLCSCSPMSALSIDIRRRFRPAAASCLMWRGRNQRLAPLQRHVANPASAQDRQRTRELIRVEIATRACQVLVAREPAEVACGVANVRYRYVTDRRQWIARLAGDTVYVPQIAPLNDPLCRI